MHKPFLLVVPLVTPPAISLDMAPLVLDGVLLAALERRLGSREEAGRALPLSWVDHGGARIAHGGCAVALVDGVSEGGRWLDLPPVTEHVHRVRSLRPAAQELVERTAFARAPPAHRSLQGTSPYRPRLRGYRTIAGLRGLAFTARGDAREIVDLLGELPGLGAMSGQGYGAIDHGRIRTLPLPDGDQAGMIFPDGSPARPLPAGLWERLVPTEIREALLARGDVIRGTWPMRPPYWQTGNEAPSVRPGPDRLVRSLARLRAELGLGEDGPPARGVEELED